MSTTVPNRRDFLVRSVGGVAAIAAGLPLLLPENAEAQSNPTDVGSIPWQARQAYIQAGCSDYSVNPNVGVGYSNPHVFGALADCLTFLQARIDYWGQGDQIASAASSLPHPIEQVSPDYARFVANQSQLAIPNDFFSLVDLGTAATDVGAPLWMPINNGNDLRSVIAQATAALEQYASRDYYSGLHRQRRVRLVNAMYQGGSGKDGTLVTAGGVLMAGGLGAIQTAGGVGVLSGTVISAAGTVGLAMAWTGVGLFVIGAALVIYVAYRLVTQRNREDTVWQKPTDRVAQQWNQRFINAPLSFPPAEPSDPAPHVWSSVCYPTCQE